MNYSDFLVIQRMLGKIEGIAFSLDSKSSAPLLRAVETIDTIINKDEHLNTGEIMYNDN